MIPAIDGARSSYYIEPPFVPPPPPPPPPPVNTQATQGPRFVGVSTNTNAGNTNSNTNVQTDQAFAQGLRGTQPQSGDLLFAQMANDVYDTPRKDAQGNSIGTGTESEAALDKAGWKRMEATPDGKSLQSANGGKLAVDPKTLTDEKTGLTSGIYTDGRGHYVVAFAGTVTNESGDIKADVQQGAGMSNAQYNQAIALARNVNQLAGPGNVAFAGHSLGGGLAAAASASTGAPAVTFNAAGVSNETLRSVGFANPNDARAAFETNGQIRSYSVDGDVLTTADENGIPPQLGAKWHAQWNDPKGNWRDPHNIVNVHGQFGDGQSYVKIMEQGQFKPGMVENPYMKGGLDIAFIGALGPAGASDYTRGFVVSQVGNVGTTAKDSLNDLLQIGGDTRSDIRSDLQGGDKFAFLRAGGEVQEGFLQTSGAMIDNLGDFTGRTVTGGTDQAGAAIRDLGDTLHVPDPLTNFSARSVENAGNLTRVGTDVAGDGLEVALDAAGDAADWTTNKVADLGDKAVDVAKVLVPIGLKGLSPHWW